MTGSRAISTAAARNNTPCASSLDQSGQSQAPLLQLTRIALDELTEGQTASGDQEIKDLWARHLGHNTEVEPETAQAKEVLHRRMEDVFRAYVRSHTDQEMSDIHERISLKGNMDEETQKRWRQMSEKASAELPHALVRPGYKPVKPPSYST